MFYHQFGDYVSVAEQRRKAEKEIARLRKKGKAISPVDAFQGQIAKSFWGRKWCENLEHYADELYRLDRGRRYARAGSICDLQIAGRCAKGLVSGTRMYSVEIEFAPLAKGVWEALCNKCSTSLGSLVELMSGRLNTEVMTAVCDIETGLFPRLREISFQCSCPDYASMCKHVSAIMYGIGRRLDSDPGILFRLRDVSPEDMLNMELATDIFDVDATLAAGDLENIFGIELDKEACELAARPGSPDAPELPERAARR